MIPGNNVLDMALSILQSQTLEYLMYVSRSANGYGQLTTQYAPPVLITGSFQPVKRQIYQELGLDFDKKYYYFYVKSNLLDINRDVSSDKLVFDGDTFQCQSAENWYQMDGWIAILCIKVSLP
jgi:hypothetical protein